METKKCCACNREFEATSKLFILDKRNPSGLGARCRECERTRLNEYHRLHPGPSRAWRQKNAEYIKNKKHLDYLNNKEKYNNRSKAYYEANKEQLHALSKQWKKDNPDKLREYSHKRYEKVKDHHRELTKRWKSDHPLERKISWQARRAKIMNLPSTLTKEQWVSAIKFFENKCAYCGNIRKLTQDHYLPVSQNGGYTCDNVIPCCLSCNSSKNNKLFADWYPTFKHYSKEREQKVIQYIELAQIASQV